METSLFTDYMLVKFAIIMVAAFIWGFING